jgi:hypothetical protein
MSYGILLFRNKNIVSMLGKISTIAKPSNKKVLYTIESEKIF